MRSPLVVLKTLQAKARDKDYAYERLYRNLYNSEFYWEAYRKIALSQGSMTAGSDGQTLDGMSIARVERIISSIKDHSYQPNPTRREYIAKKNNPAKTRPLGIPSTNDKLVQEAVRLILDAIYEPTFSSDSHGFRPNRSCHTALKDIKVRFTGAVWFIEGDIKACFDSFDHLVLINILRRRIHDEHFIALIWKFLKAGYMEQWQIHATYSGTPQGSGVSPLLANIYLNELDEYIAILKKEMDCGISKRRGTKEYMRLAGQHANQCKKYRQAIANCQADEAKAVLKKVKTIQNMKLATRCFPAMDMGYKRVQYNRYADDFVVGVIGSKDDAEQIKEKIGVFLRDKLHLTLSQEKTHVTHATKRIRYLGYDICVSKDTSAQYIKGGFAKRTWYGTIKLYLPRDKWQDKLLEYKALKIKQDKDGSERWKPMHRGALMNLPEVEIVDRFNSEIRGIYNYFKLAVNISTLHHFYHIMQRSLHKTFAAKYKTKAAKIRRKYCRNKVFTIQYATKSGTRTREFYHDGFTHDPEPDPAVCDVLPDYRYMTQPNSLAARLKKGQCELCGKQTKEIMMYHVRRLKDLKGLNAWEQKMLEIHRKSLAVCPDCFQEIHTSHA